MSQEAIPPGTLDMLILQTLFRGGRLHGFEIAEAIQERSEDVLRVEEGSLYPALQRLLLQGWIAGEWGKTEENRRARYYKITRAGHTQLERELSRYRRVSNAIGRILQPV
ncbi:MAG: PadR family transcriptional regulator [Bryobacterales bacterium]|nr:PadR family transcriptional regulator [Bryobacterales bacterium]MBV9398153.1 PadR family transcriptional regulator [Bryobacterales bacterium]